MPASEPFRADRSRAAQRRERRPHRKVSGRSASKADSTPPGPLWANVRAFRRGRIQPEDSLYIPTRNPACAGWVPPRLQVARMRHLAGSPGGAMRSGWENNHRSWRHTALSRPAFDPNPGEDPFELHSRSSGCIAVPVSRPSSPHRQPALPAPKRSLWHAAIRLFAPAKAIDSMIESRRCGATSACADLIALQG